MIEWKAVREAASRFLPKHTAAAGWKHRSLSHVEQEGLSPLAKDRGAEQGDVDGPLECSLALGMVAETRGRVAALHPSDIQRLQAEHAVRLQELPTSSWVVLENSLELTTRGTRCKKRRLGGLVVHG